MKTRILQLSLFLSLIMMVQNVFPQLIQREYSSIEPEEGVIIKSKHNRSGMEQVRQDQKTQLFASTSKNNTSGMSTEATVELMLLFEYDLSKFIVGEVVAIYDDGGYLDIVSLSNPFQAIVAVPPGVYDFFVFFEDIASGNLYTIVREQQNITQYTEQTIRPEDAVNRVQITLLDENSNVLLPGTINPQHYFRSTMIVDHSIKFHPFSQHFFTLLNNSYLLYAVGSSGPEWNFYVNDLSERYSIVASASLVGAEAGSYFNKYKRKKGISSDLDLTNDPAEWVFHTESFQPGIQSTVTHSGVEKAEIYNEKAGSRYVIMYPVGDNNPDGIFKCFLNNPVTSDDLAKVVVFPMLGERPGIINGTSHLFGTRGNEVFLDNNHKLAYGSGNESFTDQFFLGGLYFLASNFYDELSPPPHPKFSFAKEGNTILQGNNVPIFMTGMVREGDGGAMLPKYKGMYGESRDADLFATNLTFKLNGTQIYNGRYINWYDSPYFTIVDGNKEATFTNNNMTIDGLPGKNITTITYSGSGPDFPPTLQHLQYRDNSGKVTNRFDTAEGASIRIAAGDYYNFGPNYVFEYVDGSSVETRYRPYGQEAWIPLDVVKYPEFFQMPAFADYYEASLSGIVEESSTGWFDLEVTCTDSSGNTQRQIVSPAFWVGSLINVPDFSQESVKIYPNPFNNSLTLSLPKSDVVQLTISDMTGRVVLEDTLTGNTFSLGTAHLSRGVYILTVGIDGSTISKKLIKE